MYLLPCPNCQSKLPVTAAQAGDSILCPQCNGEVAVPRLGDLKQLPRQDEEAAEAPGREVVGTRSVGANIVFVVLSMVAVAALLGAGYCGIRWAMITVDADMGSHMAEVEDRYRAADPAVMIREFEDMEKFSLDMLAPYTYQKTANEKRAWGINTSIAGAIALLSGIGCLIAASRNRS